MSRLTLLCLLCLCATLATNPAVAEQPLLVVTEAVCYNNPEFGSVGLIEFPLMINRSHLRFFKPDTTDPNFYARVYAQVVVYDSSGAPVDSNSTYFSARVANLGEARTRNQMLFNKLAVLVPPGEFSARVSVIDAASKRSFETLISNINLVPSDSNHLWIAGPTLAYQATRVENAVTGINDRMVKNGLFLLNAPVGLFAQTDTVAYLYAELYGLRKTDSHQGTFRTYVTVSDAAGSFTRDLGWRDAAKPGGQAAITQAIGIKGWPVGSYQVRLTAVDPDAGDTVSTALPLRILGEVDSSVVARDPVVDPYDSLTLKEKIELVTYALSPPEMSALQKLSDVGKESFLDQYWRGADEDPATAQIENRDELIRRYRYANAHFSRYLTESTGWTTDMGRIYMKYGPWDQRQDVSAPRVGNPFSVWHYYDIREGTVFVFEDKQGSRDYRLVHSNARGERFDEGWAAFLRESMLDIK